MMNEKQIELNEKGMEINDLFVEIVVSFGRYWGCFYSSDSCIDIWLLTSS